MRARSCSRAVRSLVWSVVLTLGSSSVGPSAGRNRDAVDLLPAPTTGGERSVLGARSQVGEEAVEGDVERAGQRGRPP
jgi:hypothetical protein